MSSASTRTVNRPRLLSANHIRTSRSPMPGSNARNKHHLTVHWEVEGDVTGSTIVMKAEDVDDHVFFDLQGMLRSKYHANRNVTTIKGTFRDPNNSRSLPKSRSAAVGPINLMLTIQIDSQLPVSEPTDEETIELEEC